MSAEYGAPSGAGGGAPAPLERVLAALRQERVLNETQLADLGVSPTDIRHVLNFHVLCISCIRELCFMYVLSCI